MIWLSGLGGIQPVGSQILSNVEIAGHSWNLWKGPNANWEVLSFVSATGNINDFNVDLNDFFRKSFVVAGVFFFPSILLVVTPRPLLLFLGKDWLIFWLCLT